MIPELTNATSVRLQQAYSSNQRIVLYALGRNSLKYKYRIEYEALIRENGEYALRSVGYLNFNNKNHAIRTFAASVAKMIGPVITQDKANALWHNTYGGD